MISIHNATIRWFGFHLLIQLSPELPIRSNKASTLGSTSQGTLHFRLSASKLSKPSCSAWPSKGNQLQRWPSPLCNFKLFLFKVILICFNYGYLDKGQEVGRISMWKNKLMKTTNEKSFCKYAAMSSSSYLYSESWNSSRAKQDVSRGSHYFFFKRNKW